VVRTDFESLITPHHKTNLLGFLVLEQTNIACSSFLPLRRCGLETEELSTPRPDLRVIAEKRKKENAHFEQDLLILLVGLCFYLLSELDNGFKMGFGFLFLACDEER